MGEYRVHLVISDGNRGHRFSYYRPDGCVTAFTREEWEKFKKAVDRGFDAYETGSASDPFHEVAP